MAAVTILTFLFFQISILFLLLVHHPSVRLILKKKRFFREALAIAEFARSRTNQEARVLYFSELCIVYIVCIIYFLTSFFRLLIFVDFNELVEGLRPPCSTRLDQYNPQGVSSTSGVSKPDPGIQTKPGVSKPDPRIQTKP